MATIHQSLKKTTAYGTIGGIAGGLVMLIPWMGFMVAINLPSTLIPMQIGLMLGQQLQNAVMAGIGVHFLAGIIIGAIFGLVTGSIKALRLDRYPKGIIFGIATGIIAFVVIFMPITSTATPAQQLSLMKKMNPGMSDQALMTQLQRIQLVLFGGSLLSHIVYGAVQGAVTTMLLKVTIARSQHECEKCHQHFKSDEELVHHQEMHVR